MQTFFSAVSLVKKTPLAIPQLLRAACIRLPSRPHGNRLSSPRCVVVPLQAPSSDMAVGAPSPIEGLEPANVWAFFQQLTQIPRPSKHEEK